MYDFHKKHVTLAKKYIRRAKPAKPVSRTRQTRSTIRREGGRGGEGEMRPAIPTATTKMVTEVKLKLRAKKMGM